MRYSSLPASRMFLYEQRTYPRAYRATTFDEQRTALWDEADDPQTPRQRAEDCLCMMREFERRLRERFNATFF
jgi:hypothetical protein